MKRREFIQRMMAMGLIAATPKIIIDLAANTFRQPKLLEGWEDTPMALNPYYGGESIWEARYGYYYEVRQIIVPILFTDPDARP